MVVNGDGQSYYESMKDEGRRLYGRRHVGFSKGSKGHDWSLVERGKVFGPVIGLGDTFLVKVASGSALL